MMEKIEEIMKNKKITIIIKKGILIVLNRLILNGIKIENITNISLLLKEMEMEIINKRKKGEKKGEKEGEGLEEICDECMELKLNINKINESNENISLSVKEEKEKGKDSGSSPREVIKENSNSKPISSLSLLFSNNNSFKRENNNIFNINTYVSETCIIGEPMAKV